MDLGMPELQALERLGAGLLKLGQNLCALPGAASWGALQAGPQSDPQSDPPFQGVTHHLLDVFTDPLARLEAELSTAQAAAPLQTAPAEAESAAGEEAGPGISTPAPTGFSYPSAPRTAVPSGVSNVAPNAPYSTPAPGPSPYPAHSAPFSAAAASSARLPPAVLAGRAAPAEPAAFQAPAQAPTPDPDTHLRSSPDPSAVPGLSAVPSATRLVTGLGGLNALLKANLQPAERSSGGASNTTPQSSPGGASSTTLQSSPYAPSRSGAAAAQAAPLPGTFAAAPTYAQSGAIADAVPSAVRSAALSAALPDNFLAAPPPPSESTNVDSLKFETPNNGTFTGISNPAASDDFLDDLELAYLRTYGTSGI